MGSEVNTEPILRLAWVLTLALSDQPWVFVPLGKWLSFSESVPSSVKWEVKGINISGVVMKSQWGTSLVTQW